MPHRVRVILDEDVPPTLASALRQRGIDAVSVEQLKPSLWPGERLISDEQVCEAVASEPTVLVTLNIRDYADPAFQAANVAAHRIAVVILRVPKAESRFPQSAAAIFDIVHRHAHRFGHMYDQRPAVVSATRRGFRLHRLVP